MSTDEKDQRLKLIEDLRNVVAGDNSLREKYQIGDKFRFVRDRLQALLDQLERHEESKQIEEKKRDIVMADDDILVYVYLYNTQGATLPTWTNMLTAKLFYEYSVNRPIYTNRDHIESLIRGKANRVQHAFLTVALKKKDLIANDNPPKDMLGNAITKVREGSLSIERMVSLTHSDVDYVLSDQLGLMKKT
jgi:hypothetical protein